MNVTNDFISDFWSLYVTIIVLASIIGCGIFLFTQSKAHAPGDGTTGHVWDETLAEYNKPLPKWWMYMFYITIVFALVYLSLYNGLGSYQGAFQTNNRIAYEKEMQEAEAKFGPIFAKYQGMDIKAVAADKQAQEMGKRLFLTYCSQCHGSDAKGATGFPNLTDNDWLYGGDPETIKASLLQGRAGVMPPFGQSLNSDQIKDVANYVRSLSGLSADSLRVTRGKDVFAANCAACHGADGKGMHAMGAPNLTDSVWLYSSKEETIIDGVTKGRNSGPGSLTNTMPAWKDFLGEAKVHILAAYVYGLSAKEGQQQ